MADTLFERATNSSWVVVFKALVTTHHLMVHGNEVSVNSSLKASLALDTLQARGVSSAEASCLNQKGLENKGQEQFLMKRKLTVNKSWTVFLSLHLQNHNIWPRCRVCQDADNLGPESENSYTRLNTTWDFLTKVRVHVLADVYCHPNSCLLCMSVKIFLEL